MLQLQSSDYDPSRNPAIQLVAALLPKWEQPEVPCWSRDCHIEHHPDSRANMLRAHNEFSSVAHYGRPCFTVTGWLWQRAVRSGKEAFVVPRAAIAEAPAAQLRAIKTKRHRNLFCVIPLHFRRLGPRNVIKRKSVISSEIASGNKFVANAKFNWCLMGGETLTRVSADITLGSIGWGLGISRATPAPLGGSPPIRGDRRRLKRRAPSGRM